MPARMCAWLAVPPDRPDRPGRSDRAAEEINRNCSGDFEAERNRRHDAATTVHGVLPQDVFSRKIRSAKRNFKLRPAGATPVLKGDMLEAATAID